MRQIIYKTTIHLMVLTLFAITNVNVYGKFLDIPQESLDANYLAHFMANDYKDPFQRYILPNETRPKLARNILDHAPKGIYLSVGPERGFMGAAYAKNTTHLLLLDYSPTIVCFNDINIILLKMSTSMEDYRHLRIHATESEWYERSKQANLTMDEKKYIASESTFEFWSNRGRHSFLITKFLQCKNWTVS